ncbi:unnamed protein product [Cylicostephanus goldi]|uniref:Uncharacterized protein n=1 Tax=Cylicostephanus goldi TaxID=71465 RepID=A0A3P7MT73_CYLGO|nr:unnamed protein product [Cylicostephanus goldi]
MMVELLCGIMGGSSFGKSIRKWQTTDENANLGQCFVAIDPECFAPGFSDRLSCFLDETRELEPLDGIVYKKSQLKHLVSWFELSM